MKGDQEADVVARTVRTERLEMVDCEGRVRAVLDMDISGPCVHLLNADGNAQASLGLLSQRVGFCD